MIYFLYGSDTAKVREKLNALTGAMTAKKPDAAFFKIDADNFSEARFDELVLGQGLFEQKYIIAVDGVFEKKDAKDFIFEKLEEIGRSDNIFIFLENKIVKADISKIKKYAEKVLEFEKKEPDTKEEKFNVFSLTDAIGRRDRKSAWVVFQEAVFSGLSPEELHGTIFWQIKNILLVKRSTETTASVLGMKPFVFNKTTSFAKNFSEGELKNMISDLVSMYHNARKSGTLLEVHMERFVLSI